jgi:hypothetical protein
MQPLEKLKMMEKIVRELEDLANSQTAILKKISQIEADNINLNNKGLEEKLMEIFEHISDNQDLVGGLVTSFGQETDKYRTDNRLDEVPDLES